ncbi:MAG: tetratricopeptide repeat protein [Anaerolineae bacterium]
MSDDLSFGGWLKRRRRGLGLTQVELGQRIGYSGETIRKVEADEFRPSRQMAEALAAALDIAPTDHDRFIEFARGIGQNNDVALPTDPVDLSSPHPSSRLNHNLPTPPTPLVDRQTEVAALRKLLLRDDARLVTLTGAGGTGKTRVALAAATAALDDFLHGVFFVDLAPLRDSALVASTIARTLDVRETAGHPYLTAVEDYLREKSLLLLLDNFEQVLDAAPILADLLAAAPRIKLLVTSREVLRLRAEHVFPVEPLAVPSLRDLPPIDELTAYPAVALFAERAGNARPGFRMSAENGEAVAEICTQLDGLPLAIELAAARVRLLPPAALLSRLGKGLTLTAGVRDLPARQQTLRATIEWSYNLLSEEEKALLRRLGVFVGGATLEAIEAVCYAGDDTAGDVLDGISALTDKSLLRQAVTQGEPSFRMLEAVHEYALERLEESGEAQALRRRHADYFLALAEQAEPELLGLHQIAWLERLEREHDNLRAALQWSFEAGDLDTALRLAGALGWFWYLHSHLVEGRTWLDRVSRQAGEQSTATGAKVLAAAGTLAFAQGDFTAARALHEQALALYREVGDARGEASSLDNLGVQMLAQGELEAAKGLLEQSASLYRETGDRVGLMNVLNNLGEVARTEGDYAAAERYYVDGLALVGQARNSMLVAWLLHNLGHVALYRNDIKRADDLFRESFAAGQEMGFMPVIIACIAGFAAVWGARGDATRATRLFAAADAMLAEAHSHLDRPDSMAYDRYLAAARAGLDAEAFERAWAEGRAMTQEEAVAYALEETQA